MKSGKSWWALIGTIVLESIWIIDLAVELYTGEVTYTELVFMLMCCLILAVFIYFMIRRRIQKSRENGK